MTPFAIATKARERARDARKAIRSKQDAETTVEVIDTLARDLEKLASDIMRHLAPEPAEVRIFPGAYTQDSKGRHVRVEVRRRKLAA